ncbi:hypothetical protein FRC07_007581 [Ceratobasidium sp. 392]|nr:hypothetical protein FRC07_007581 [Ceratobasidium sp. 392]
MSSSTSSAGHGQYMRATPRGRPSSYYSADTVNLAEAFADVNRALAGSRATRQSTAGGSSSQAGPSRALKTPSPEPPRPRMLKKPQAASDSSARVDMSRSTETRRREEVANPRHSIASEPTYDRPPVAPWGHLRVEDRSRRASMVEQSMTPRRPDLRITIPGAPPASRAHHGQREAANQGHRPAPAPASKHHSSCVIM